jgi:hypothetical protein
MIDALLYCMYDGESLIPCGPVWAKRADKQLVVGERYRVQTVEERSAATHNHEFAWLHEAWLNLPEKIADLYPSVEHLRKRALIDAGYYDEDIIDAGTNAAALRVAAFARKDNFALVIVRGPLVAVRTAKSQSRRHMDRKTFQASKSAVMEVVASLLGTTTEALKTSETA